jgi:FKBP-type peptidyl-prolyl cis-trans isomerase
MREESMGIRSSGLVLMAAAMALAGCGSDTTTAPSIFRAEDIVVGTGDPAVAGDALTVDYIGALANGQVFDDSYARGEPYTFRLGAGTVIQGWDHGLVGMRVGGKRRLIIPPALAYGSQGQSPIPPNATLTFDIELIANAGH